MTLHGDITPSQSVKRHRWSSFFCPVYLWSLFNLRYKSGLIYWLIELFIFRANLITRTCHNCICCRIINNHCIHCNHSCWLVFCCEQVKKGHVISSMNGHIYLQNVSSMTRPLLTDIIGNYTFKMIVYNAVSIMCTYRTYCNLFSNCLTHNEVIINWYNR